MMAFAPNKTSNGFKYVDSDKYESIVKVEGSA